MPRFNIVVLAISLLAPAAFAATPGSSADGERLHAAKCAGCHDTAVYTRKDRRVRSLDGLKHQLEGCAHMAKEDFSPAETQSLLKFLNDRYYHFP